MNNSQFRSLLSSTPTPNGNSNAASSTPSSNMRPPTLGSRARSSIPMTPRTVAGGSHIDFRRQLSDLNSSEPPTKKFKSSGPKGAKLRKGYVDRSAALRTAGSGEGAEGNEETGENSKEERLKRLEEMFKLQQIDEGMLEAMRRELGVGGRVETSHLVKGLDWELLKRVRRGEDVLATQEVETEEKEEVLGGEGAEDVEDELDGVLNHEVQATKKKEEDATSTSLSTVEEPDPETEVLSRDEILRRLKASRSAVAMPPPPPPPSTALNDRFKKVGSDSKAEKKRFTEVVDGRRREVLLTTDKEGRSKRKVRWLDPPGTQVQVEAVVEKPKEVMGMDVPAEIVARQKAALELQMAEEEGDDDIFAGVGADYDPLKDIGSDEDEDDKVTAMETHPVASQDSTQKPEHPRNYFGDTTEDQKDKSNPIANDPTILAALKRAAALRQAEAASGGADKDQDQHADEEHDPERALKRKAFLEKLKQQQAEDARDLDMGFGESRFGDDEDEDGPLYGSGDDKGHREKRKRAPKKRRGDKDNVKDVLGVLEGRKGR